MQITTFAAIDIGSYELGMKIFELSARNGMREIDYIRHRIELGKDTYGKGKIGCGLTDELCNVLYEFTEIMKTYRVDNYRACATSAVRESRNSIVILDQIRLRTGLKVEVLSNSEQRFLGYKSIASKENDFNKIIQKGTAIIDVGGGSIQISLFDKDSLVTTQNLKLGNLRVREKLSSMEARTTHFYELVEELINTDIYNFKKLFLKDREIKNIIMVGDYISHIINKANEEQDGNSIDRVKFMKYYELITRQTPEQIAVTLEIPAENASLIVPSLIIYRRLIEETGAEFIWAPGLNLSDGLAYDYAEHNKIIRVQHNFENDILAAARNIAKRYMSNKSHVSLLDYLAMIVFDSMKRVHGLGKRERLLLQIAVLLHDCGKYISLSHSAECSYNIIMSSEIIGLSHMEREIIANVVRYNTVELDFYEEMSSNLKLDQESYLLVSKLTAILRVVNVMDRSHKQKFKDVRAVLKENELIITVNTSEDIVLEKGLFADKADFFEEVFSIKPVIKQKRILYC